MSYDIEYVAAVITTSGQMKERMGAEQYLNFFSPIQRDLIADILVDLDLVSVVWEPYSVWDDRFAKERGRYVMVWKTDD